MILTYRICEEENIIYSGRIKNYSYDSLSNLMDFYNHFLLENLGGAVKGDHS